MYLYTNALNFNSDVDAFFAQALRRVKVSVFIVLMT